MSAELRMPEKVSTQARVDPAGRAPGLGLSEVLLGLIASGTFAGYLIGLLSVPHLAARRGERHVEPEDQERLAG